MYKTVAFIFLLLPTVSKAADINMNACSDCSASQTEWMAKSYALSNEAPIGESAFNVLDTRNFNIDSYKVTKYVNPNYPMISREPYFISVLETQTPPNLLSKSIDLQSAAAKISQHTSSNNIPVSVLDDPWRYTNCAYCSIDIEDFLRNNAQFDNAVEVIDQLLKQLNITAVGLDNIYEMGLDAGGRVRLQLEVTNEGELLVKVVAVIDSNNNVVPATSALLKNLQIRLGGLVTPSAVNRFITNYGFYVPNIPRGTVTITDCPPVAVEGQPCQ